jgi:hypothetical protein
MTQLLSHVRHNVVAYLALFVALGGTSYAAVSLPRGSVGSRQLKNHSITPVKESPKYINGNVRAWAIVSPTGKILAGAGRPSDESAISLASSDTFQVRWGIRLPRTCATVATVDAPLSNPTESGPLPGNPAASLVAGYAVVFGSHWSPTSPSGTVVRTFDQSGKPTPLAFDVAVIC